MLCGRPAEDVHHIESVATRPDLAFVVKNLLPVCEPCHGKVEAAEGRGLSVRDFLPADFKLEVA